MNEDNELSKSALLMDVIIIAVILLLVLGSELLGY